MDLELEPVKRITKDILDAQGMLSPHEARFLVDAYYVVQEDRKRGANQVRALSASGEPHAVLQWFAKQSEVLEAQVARALDRYSAQHPVGAWMREIDGIGPVIAAGLLAHIDITKAPTVGHIWRFAGLDPSMQWFGKEKGDEMARKCVSEAGGDMEAAALAAAMASKMNPERFRHYATHNRDGEEQPLTQKSIAAVLAKRPWNADLKTLCWKVGESFVKVSGKESAYYGRVYAERKAQEVQRNDSGAFSDQAAAILAGKRIGKDTDAYKSYIVGKLPPAHLHSRAKRYAVKLFLSHLHEVWRKAEGLPVPLPYPIAFLGHAHKIEVPV